jgi:D-glycero-alpha-D-manno-heptose-7-phosphate kinase
MKPVRIYSKAPTRIDLAGGTVDLWPIYLFLKGAKTINLGINLFAETELELIPGKNSILFESKDQAHEHRFQLEQIDELPEHPALILHQRLLNHFLKQYPDIKKRLRNFDLKVKTSAKSPAGAGLGGSSTLAVSIIHAYWKCFFPNQAPNPIHLLEIVRDVETQVIKVPAGLQDYYGATFGGLQAIHWKEAVNERVPYSDEHILELQNRLILFYSGQSRNSGINNWQLFKSFIDQSKDVVRAFQEIVSAAEILEHSLIRKDYRAAVKAIEKEWSARRTLAQGISTSEIDEAFSVAKATLKSASPETEIAMKICGAGGGGCFFMILDQSNPKLIQKISDEVTKHIPQIRRLPFEAIPHGVIVTENSGF